MQRPKSLGAYYTAPDDADGAGDDDGEDGDGRKAPQAWSNDKAKAARFHLRSAAAFVAWGFGGSDSGCFVVSEDD